MNVKDLTGSRFGRLTALERLPRKYRSCFYWRCRCDCGNVCEVPSTFLTHGTARSCGCLQDENRRRDITGEKRGHLTALRPVGISPGGATVWRWRCECGNEIEKAVDLIGNRRSTMCPLCINKLKSRQAKTMADNQQRDADTGAMLTQIDAILEGRLPSNNSTGVRGVTYDVRTQKYRARASDHGRQIHLGTFDTLEEAQEARKRAVERLYADRDDKS